MTCEIDTDDGFAALSGDFSYGLLHHLEGGGHGKATLGSSSVSSGSGRFDSYSILELVHRQGMPDIDNTQTNEIDWIATTNTVGNYTNKKIAAIEVFLEGVTALDRGGKWHLNTKRDGGVLELALEIDNKQRTCIGQRGTAAEPTLVNFFQKTTGLFWIADGPNYSVGVSVAGVEKMRVRTDEIKSSVPLTIAPLAGIGIRPIGVDANGQIVVL